MEKALQDSANENASLRQALKNATDAANKGAKAAQENEDNKKRWVIRLLCYCVYYYILYYTIIYIIL